MTSTVFLSNSTSNFIDRVLRLSNENREQSNLRVTYSEVKNHHILELAQDLIDVSEKNVQHVRLETQSLDQLNAIDLNHLGNILGSIAFPEQIRKSFIRDLDHASKTDKRLRIHIEDHHSLVSGWPWEFLWLNTLGFLCVNPNCSIVRASQTDYIAQEPWKVPEGDQLNLLIVWADPGVPYGPLDARPQIDTIIKLTRDLALKDLNIRTLLPRRLAENSMQVATLSNLRQVLVKQPAHIVYFMTHGDFDKEKQQGLIVMEGENDTVPFQHVLASELESLFAAVTKPFVIIFDGCRSASRGPEGTGKSLAEAVTRFGHTVVGMQYTWPAAACHPFWREFFRMFAVPRPLDECIFASRDYLYRLANSLPQTELKKHVPAIPESATFSVGDWGFPVMYRTYLPLLESKRPKPQATLEDNRTSNFRNLTQEIGAELMKRLLKLDQQEIHSITEMIHQATDSNHSTKKLLQREDPLSILLAGSETLSEQQVINTSPIWFTQLLAAPDKFVWDHTPIEESYKIRLWSVDEGDILTAETITSWFELTAEHKKQLPVDQHIRWEIQVEKTDSTLVRGIFRILPLPQANLITQTSMITL